MTSKTAERSIAWAAGMLLAFGMAAGPAAADDTEIFFGELKNGEELTPNVLFILDTSGSMAWGDPDQEGSRLSRLQSAMHDLLESATDLNIGLMGLNGSKGGGAILYPVTPIDQIVCNGFSCDEINLRATISAPEDDTEERLVNGRSQAGGIYLSIGLEQNFDQRVGLRFRDLRIPQGATITSAVLEMDAARTNNEATTLTYRAEDVDDSAALTNANDDLRQRVLTTASAVQNPEPWQLHSQYQSGDLSSVVQEVVDRNGWCGGNALTLLIDGDDDGARSIKSVENVLRNNDDNAVAGAATLRIGYEIDNLLPGEGCTVRSAVARVSHNNDDAQQNVNNGTMNLSSGGLGIPHDGRAYQRTGVRFAEVAIPQNADIVSARIEFEVDAGRGGNALVKILGEASGNPARYSNTRWQLSQRPRTLAAVDWTSAPALPTNSKIETPDLAPIVQELVRRVDWSADNAMAFMFQLQGNTASAARVFESHNGELAAAPKLIVNYRAKLQAGDLSALQVTARKEMKEIVDSLVANHGTPLVGAHYEAAQYLLGKPVDYGRTRGAGDGLRWKNVSHAGSYTNGRVITPSGCTADNPNSSACQSERIVSSGGGQATYTSPLENSCIPSHIVLLSDGVASPSDAKSRVQSLIEKADCDDNSAGEACGTNLASWLFDTDHNGNVARKQNIITHTIGFNLTDPAYLEKLAAAGGGGFYSAESSTQLVSVFKKILGGVNSIDTGFTAPGATVNQFNRLTHRDDVYFALFKPTEEPTWQGNLKRYRVARVDANDPDSESEILDANGNVAIDPETGFFAAGARSFWREPDGNGGTVTTPDADNVERGGAAMLMDVAEAGGRNVYTFLGDHAAIPTAGIDLTATSQQLHEDNDALDDAALGITNARESEADQTAFRRSLVQWIRGVDIKNDDQDDDITESRRHMGDPMHSRPLIVNYDDGATEESIVYVATNEGLLHAIDTESGIERWAFSPKALLPNHFEFFDNDPASKHPYGLDGPMSIWRDDPNGNFVVENGESAYLYTSMRRGGNNYYAFDITDPDSPTLAWVIEGGPGGTPGFELLGQSWSRMTPAKMKIDDKDEDVLIFGGGYDERQDPDKNTARNALIASQPVDVHGRGIFIVRATTGELLWSLLGKSGGAAGKSQVFTDMKYAIPADVRVVDINLDGYADQLYAADMGGQVWRFDLNSDPDSTDLMQGGVMAKLNGRLPRDHRRFYNEPDVALIAKGGTRFLAVSIGSGWRAHPLNDVVEDRQYMIKSTAIRGAPEGYGKKTLFGTWTPITEQDLVKVDGTVLDPPVNDYGWYATFEDAGEKVLGRSVIFENTVYFSTYVPDSGSSVCNPAIGGGYAYALDVLNGGPARNLNKVDAQTGESNPNDRSIGLEDRRVDLNHGGIPPEPMILMPQDGSKPILLFGTEKVDSGLENNTTRTYWADTGPAAALPDPEPTTPTEDAQ